MVAIHFDFSIKDILHFEKIIRNMLHTFEKPVLMQSRLAYFYYYYNYYYYY